MGWVLQEQPYSLKGGLTHKRVYFLLNLLLPVLCVKPSPGTSEMCRPPEGLKRRQVNTGNMLYTPRTLSNKTLLFLS